jgi:hypothetical protein
LDDAVSSRELRDCDTDGLARVVEETLHGALVKWAIYREGSALLWLRRDLEFLLTPYLAPKRQRVGQLAPSGDAAAQSVRDHQGKKQMPRSRRSKDGKVS